MSKRKKWNVKLFEYYLERSAFGVNMPAALVHWWN